MKTFTNPLEHVLEIRRLQQQQRETEMAVAVQDRDGALAVFEAIEARRREAQKSEAVTSRHAARQLLLRERFVDHQHRLATQQRETVNQKESTVLQRRDELVSARCEVRKLEKHRSRLFEKWQLEFRREEQRDQDDMVAGRRLCLQAVSTLGREGIAGESA